MMALFHRSVVLVLAALLAGGSVVAGTVSGVVRNGTTGAVTAGQDVILIQLQGGMETVASTRTDAQGRYTLDHPAIGRGPVLVRVVYRGVNYHQNVPPGRTVADVEIFEPTADPASFQVLNRVIVFQPSGSSLLVGEEYAVHNHTKPPAAFFKSDGTFEFGVPEGAELGQVAAWGPAGMPVGQGTMEKGKNRYAIAFPFRPGENGVRLAYQLPYSGNRAVVRPVSVYAAQRVSLIAPPSVQVEAAGFQLTGTDQGYNVYSRDAFPAGEALEVTVSGTAPPPSANEAPGAPPQDSGQPGTASSVPVTQLPGRLDNFKWILIGGFSALFALGVVFLWRKPRGEVAFAGATASGNSRKAEKALAAVDREVGRSLDEIKEELFRLELRRQAGTISEEEYARGRGRAEKFLRDFLKG